MPPFFHGSNADQGSAKGPLASGRFRRKLREVTTPPPESVAPKVLPGWRRSLLTVLSVMLLLTFLGIAVAYIFGYSFAKYFVESPAGQRVASTSVGHAIKVDGEFAPLKLDHWTIITDSFTSTGWPGEAIGGLKVYGVRAEFDPEAIWRGVYHIKGITVERGQFTLRTPNDALKRPMPPKKPRPWWAHFLPSVFECGPIVSPDANVDFEFENQEAHIQHAPLQADLIGKDFRYTATGGTLAFPYLPPMHIDRLKIMVTRPLLTIEEAELSGVDPNDPVRMTLHGEMGQHADKTIKAIVQVTQMPIAQMLPAELAPLIHGRLTGHLTWDRDETGDAKYSEGDLDLSGASIDDLAVFKQLSALHGNPDLLNFTFDTFHVKFRMKNGYFTGDILAVSAGKFALAGNITYDMPTKLATLDLKFTQLPLKVWLPSDFKPRYDGVATASLQWRGQLNTVKDSSGELSVNLDGTHVTNPPLLRALLKKTSLRTPEEINFKTAQFDFTYKDQVFQLTRAQIDAPGFITANVTGTLATPDKTLDAVMTWSGLKLSNWLPPKMAQQLSGDVGGGVKVHVRQWQFKDGSYGGDIQMVNGQLAYTSVQSMVARFVNDKRLLDIPLTRASFSWTFNAGALAVTNIDLRAGDAFGVQGNLGMSADGQVSGVLSVGIRPDYVGSLMGLGNAVFKRDDEGLRWAKVTVSGTTKKPKQDLSSQLMAQLPKHPLVVFGLAGKMASWYVGDWFGAAEEWKRPKRTNPDVVVGR